MYRTILAHPPTARKTISMTFTTTTTLNSRHASITSPDNHPRALTSPLPLYRRILRAHRKYLPPAERTLGDTYVKAEFRAHRGVKNPLHVVGFLTEWSRYVGILEGGHHDRREGSEGEFAKGSRGKDRGLLNMGRLEKMSENQLYQLYEMMMAAKGLYASPKGQERINGAESRSMSSSVTNESTTESDEIAQEGEQGREVNREGDAEHKE